MINVWLNDKKVRLIVWELENNKMTWSLKVLDKSKGVLINQIWRSKYFNLSNQIKERTFYYQFEQFLSP